MTEKDPKPPSSDQPLSTEEHFRLAGHSFGARDNDAFVKEMMALMKNLKTPSVEGQNPDTVQKQVDEIVACVDKHCDLQKFRRREEEPPASS